MKTYLVGGAVRDEALSRPVHERDWVVVGGTPEALRAEGYIQVGRDFPVFLHPVTREEYALARVERKSAPGYYGFTCDANPHVTLEEDLARRDLTINAMARDADGTLVDPYHGMQDLALKRLRHVSSAFIEDPVRVLRVARFAARYDDLGFRVAPETQALMYTMVRHHELRHLVVERVWQECVRALGEPKPRVFFDVLRGCGALSVILPELDALFGVPNAAATHEEIDVGVGMLQRLTRVAAFTTETRIRFAALVLDLGKACTPIGEWPHHGDVESRSVSVITALCQRLKIPNEYRELAVLSARFYGEIQRGACLSAEDVVRVLEHTDAFRRPMRFQELLTLCQASEVIQQPSDARWSQALETCRDVRVDDLIGQIRGDAIKAALFARRVEAVRGLLTR